MDHVRTLSCVVCGAEYDPGEVAYTCPEHPGVEGVLEVLYDYETIHDRFDAPLDGRVEDLWKYRAFLPVPADAEPVTLGEGGTPLLPTPRLGDELGVALSVKDDGRNPTGVLKDRATTVALTRARAEGFDTVTCASTGNAAASLAGYAARAGLDCRIFVPEDAPEGKLAQPLVYGADVLAVRGSYDEAYDLSMEVTERFGWYNRNAAINPYQVEGKRTVGHELAEQVEEVPDWVVFSMGDGCTVHGGWKGFREFADLGYVGDVPRFLGVQSERAPAIHEAFHGDGGEREAGTVADSISVGRPRNTEKACRALRESGGTSVLVSDEEIIEAEALLGRTEGIYAEPAGAAPVAGLQRAREAGIVDPGDSIVVVVTGTGLKDTESGLRAGGDVTSIDPAIEDVEARYGESAR